jgi:hypothetical protein
MTAFSTSYPITQNNYIMEFPISDFSRDKTKFPDINGRFHYTAWVKSNKTDRTFHVISNSPLLTTCPMGIYRVEQTDDGYYISENDIFITSKCINDLTWYRAKYKGELVWVKCSRFSGSHAYRRGKISKTVGGMTLKGEPSLCANTIQYIHIEGSIGQYKLTDDVDPVCKLTNISSKPDDIKDGTLVLPIISFKRKGGPNNIGLFHYTAYLFDYENTKQFSVGNKHLRECTIKSDTPLLTFCPAGYYKVQICEHGYYISTEDLFTIKDEGGITLYFVNYDGRHQWAKITRYTGKLAFTSLFMQDDMKSVDLRKHSVKFHFRFALISEDIHDLVERIQQIPTSIVVDLIRKYVASN